MDAGILDVLAHAVHGGRPLGFIEAQQHDALGFMALRALFLNDVFALAIDQRRLLFVDPHFDAAHITGPARPAVGELRRLRSGQRQVCLGGLARCYFNRLRAALKAIANALHPVLSRRQVLRRVMPLRLADDHEGQALFRVVELHKGAGERLA